MFFIVIVYLSTVNVINRTIDKSKNNNITTHNIIVHIILVIVIVTYTNLKHQHLYYFYNGER